MEHPNPPFERLNQYLDKNDLMLALFLTLAGAIQLCFFDYLPLKDDWLLAYSLTIAGVSVCYLILLIHTVFRILIGHRKVKLQDVIFFLLSYTVFIVQFALYYGCLDRFLTPRFGASFMSNVGELKALDFLYYSGVVMTTLGFGDIVPLHAMTKLLAVFQATLGQTLLVLSIGSVIGRIQNR